MATMPGLFDRGARAQSAALNVFSPLPPDPAPPGAAKFSEDAFAKWQADNGATVYGQNRMQHPLALRQ